ncbi:hypothetical protein PMI11_02256 [Rhizobium sp. CF142]|nr:hypothetical protein PMI11_02256 [Rhizobium sp. CF142]
MRIMKSIELDEISRATVGRFVWKCYIALAIALLVRSNTLETASKCLLLYAALMMMVASFTRQRYHAGSFNHWSEALWLAFVAAGLHLLQ